MTKIQDYPSLNPATLVDADKIDVSKSDSTPTWESQEASLSELKTYMGVGTAQARILYVDANGNDSNNGSIGSPYLTFAAALTAANAAAGLLTPYIINVGSSIHTIDNSAGAITINEHITIQGEGLLRVVFSFNTATNDGFTYGKNVHFNNIQFVGITGATNYVLKPTDTVSGNVGIVNCGFASVSNGILTDGTTADFRIFLRNLAFDNYTGQAIKCQGTAQVFGSIIDFDGGGASDKGVWVTGNAFAVFSDSFFRNLSEAWNIDSGTATLRINGARYEGITTKFNNTAGTIVLEDSPFENITLTERTVILPTTNPAASTTTNDRPGLDFDDTTNESAIWATSLNGYYNENGLEVELIWSSESAIVGNVKWDVSFERIEIGTTDLATTSFASAQTTTTTTAGTIDRPNSSIISFTNAASIDNLVNKESFRIKVERDTSVGSNMIGDAKLETVIIRERI